MAADPVLSPPLSGPLESPQSFPKARRVLHRVLIHRRVRSDWYTRREGDAS